MDRTPDHHSPGLRRRATSSVIGTLTKYATYDNELRTHRSLNKDATIRRAIQHVGRIVSAPVLGGLHHHNCRIWFSVHTTPPTQDRRRLSRYMRCWLVERFFAWIQWQCRILVRWDTTPRTSSASYSSLASLIGSSQCIRNKQAMLDLEKSSYTLSELDVAKMTARHSRNSFELSTFSQALHPPFGVPEGDGYPSGYHGRDRRLRPLRREVGWVCEDITDECCNRADRRLSSGAVDRPVHLCKKGNRNGRTDNAANRGEECVLETERGENISARHYEKAGEPSPSKLFGGGASKPSRAKIV
jgi:hypothetical protein